MEGAFLVVWTGQARPMALRSPEERASVSIVRASFPKGREEPSEALSPLLVSRTPRRGFSFAIVSSWRGTPSPEQSTLSSDPHHPFLHLVVWVPF